MFADVSGYVLAGGLSTRMGSDKAMLQVDGVPLIQRAVDLLQSTCAFTFVSSGPPTNRSRESILEQYAPIVPDATQGHEGPLAAVSAALQHCDTPFAMLIAVDQVAIPASLLTALIDAAHSDTVAAVVSSEPDRAIAPLPLLLSQQLAGAIRQQLAAGERRLLAGVQQAVLSSGGKLLVLPPRPEYAGAYLNLNSPDDLERWKKSLHLATNSSPSRASE